MECVLSYRAGAARVCITPDEPLWLAGYASRTGPARGKISELYASALALEDATGQRFVVVSVDLIAVTSAIAELVSEHARSTHSLPRSQLLLAATHTHYGPEFRPDKQEFFNIPSEYAARLAPTADRLAHAVCDAIDQAVAKLTPARLFVRQTRISFAHNRRRHGVKLGTPCRDDIVDHDVPILEVVDASGVRKAIVFGYACHNTTIPPDDLRYCSDWAGFARDVLQQTRDAAMALFLPGAGADQDPEPTGSVEISRQHGQDLAEAVTAAIGESGEEIRGPLRVATDEISLPLQPVTQQSLDRMLTSDDQPQQVKARFLLEAMKRGEELISRYSAPIQVVRFGNELLMIALSGEPVVDWAIKLKSEFGSAEVPCGSADFGKLSRQAGASTTRPIVWVAGYCHDMFGYLPTRRVQREGGYEGGRANLWSSIPAPFTDEVEDLITDAVRRLVNKTTEHGTTQDTTDVR